MSDYEKIMNKFTKKFYDHCVGCPICLQYELLKFLKKVSEDFYTCIACESFIFKEEDEFFIIYSHGKTKKLFICQDCYKKIEEKNK